MVVQLVVDLEALWVGLTGEGVLAGADASVLLGTGTAQRVRSRVSPLQDNPLQVDSPQILVGPQGRGQMEVHIPHV